MEQTFIANSIVTFISNRFTLDSNLSNVLNIAILKLLNCANQINYSKLKIPKWITMVLKQILANAKYGILLYLIKLLIAYKLSSKPIETALSTKVITTELDNGLFVIDISNVDKLISTVHKFIDLHPEFFQNDINYQLITLPNNSEPLKVYNDKLHFKDTIHNVEGFITTEFTKTIKNEKENTYICNNQMHLYIKKNEPNDHCYMNQLEQYVNQETRFGSVVNLYYYKILPRNLITSNFYHEPLDRWKDDCEYMEDTFFSEYKKFMFTIMKEKINYDISSAGGWNNLILHGPAGCHAINTPILMYDGTYKMVQDIEVNELLMGDDSTPRTVLSLCRNNDYMYEITNTKNESYVVNGGHILCLIYSTKKCIKHRLDRSSFQVRWWNNIKYKQDSKTFKYNNTNQDIVYQQALEFLEKTNEDCITEISVNDYLKLSKSYQIQLKEYKVPVEFNEIEVPIDPYLIGYWLGDGTASKPEITTQDSTIIIYLKKNLAQYNCYLQYYTNSDYRYRINGIQKGKFNNYFLNQLTKLNIKNNKHIPYIYKCNSRKNRLKLLAGLIDSDGSLTHDGCTFELSQSHGHEILMDDIIYLSKSLGFSSYKQIKKTSWTYKGEKKYGTAIRICISGNGTHEIPTLIKRKQANIRKQVNDNLVSGISIKPLTKDNYYGFEIDGNHRYIMNNCVVTHNTGKSSFIYRIATIMKKSIISVDLSLYLDKKKELYALFHGQEFKLPEGNDNYNVANNTIIILEEFDNTIKKLVDLEQIYKLKQDLIELDFDKKKQSLINDNGETDIITSDDPRPKKEKLSIAKVTHEIDQILHTNNINIKSDILRISDLLELFQGPVPVKDRLIIATTNYYDDIKNTLPALFRPGRLSPLAFNYLTWDLLNELTQYYFDTQMTVDQFKITIPTSQIIELALRYKNDFESFQEELVLLHECESDGPLTF